MYISSMQFANLCNFKPDLKTALSYKLHRTYTCEKFSPLRYYKSDSFSNTDTYTTRTQLSQICWVCSILPCS